MGQLTFITHPLRSSICNKMSKLQLKNPFLSSNSAEIFFHLGLSTTTHNIVKMFSDVKVVCLGGSSRRMKALAEVLAAMLGIKFPTGQGLVNICASTDRYVMYKVGPILAANHGIGMPSLSIVLHEIAKLLQRAGCVDPIFFRVGTCGGLGLEPGTICISQGCCDTQFRPFLEQHIMGQRVERPAMLDAGLTEQLRLAAAEVLAAGSSGGSGTQGVASGTTLCTNDFYEEQGRMDGAVCDFTEEQRRSFLHEAHARGVRNLEMESLEFAAFTHKLGLRAACMTLVLVNRFQQDQVSPSCQQIAGWELGLTQILAAYIRRQKLIPESY